MKSVTIHDPSPVALADLGTQYYLREADVGRPRGEVTVPRLAELNSYVPVHNLEAAELSEEVLGKYQVCSPPAWGRKSRLVPDGLLLCLLRSLSSLGKLRLTRRSESIASRTTARLPSSTLRRTVFLGESSATSAFLGVTVADAKPPGSSVFNDFGPAFTCIDPTGEQPLTGMVVSVENGDDAMVTCLDETRHGLEDGDYVTFSEVVGMEELNSCEPRKVSVKGASSYERALDRLLRTH